MKKVQLIFIATLVLILFHSCTKEFPSGNIDEEITKIATKYVINGRTPGIIIGTIKNGVTKTYSFGVSNLKTGEPINENTIFDIGSITKTFTGLVFAQLVLEGKLSLMDTANKYLPANLQLPSKENIPITIGQLLNHTSGLERQPKDLNLETPLDYDENKLSAYLSTTSLLTVPGTKFEYSNTGVGLAGYILTKKLNSTYSTIIQKQVFDKLGMTKSSGSIENLANEKLSQGYFGNKEKGFVNMNDLFAGSGQIKSNMHDMLIYLDNLINPNKSLLKDAIELTLVPTFSNKETFDVGINWLLQSKSNNETFVFHDGATLGYSSFIGFNPITKTGVVVLINSYCLGEQDLIGAEVMLQLSK
jgi:CubicO group peptidase (beta-lactamase class C family)